MYAGALGPEVVQPLVDIALSLAPAEIGGEDRDHFTDEKVGLVVLVEDREIGVGRH